MRNCFALIVGLVASVATSLAGTPTASAGGFDWPGMGTRGAGRAGAWRARTDSPLALHLNPANLARLSGVQAEVSVHLAMLNACFDRSGTVLENDDGTSRLTDATDPNELPDDVFGDPEVYGTTEYPTICEGAGIFPIPQAGLSWRVHDRVGIGLGLIAPNNVGARSFGNTSGANTGRYAVPDAPSGFLPASSRYDIIEGNLLLAFVAVGAGVELHPRVRVGATLGWGFATTKFVTMSGAFPGEDPAAGALASVDASDIFVPRVVLSAAAEPIDGLDVMVGFTWTDDVNATGDINFRAEHFLPQDARDARDEALAFSGAMLDGAVPTALNAPQTSALSFGVRYAMLRAAPEGRGEHQGANERDPMTDEVFDIEFDLTATFGSRVDKFVTGPDGDRIGDTVQLAFPVNQLPDDLELGHSWKTQIGLHLGGDYNVIPGRFALRLGVAYETHGVEDGFERLDFMPWQRIAFGAGFTARISRFELSMAYMHLHWFDRTVAPGEGRVEQTTLMGGTIINEGSYSASADLLSISLAYRFL